MIEHRCWSNERSNTLSQQQSMREERRNDKSGNKQQKGGQKKPPPSSGGAAGGSTPRKTPLTRVSYQLPAARPHLLGLPSARQAARSSRTDSDSQPILKGSSTEERAGAERRLQEEQQSVSGNTNVVTTGQKKMGSEAVGPTLCKPVKVGGVEVEVMVDTGSQSTIISWSFLHAIGAHCRSQDLPCPTLEVPTVRLLTGDHPPSASRQDCSDDL